MIKIKDHRLIRVKDRLCRLLIFLELLHVYLNVHRIRKECQYSRDSMDDLKVMKLKWSMVKIYLNGGLNFIVTSKRKTKIQIYFQ